MLGVISIPVAVLAYLAVGLLFASGFLTVGVGRRDPGARGAGWGFRLMLLPSVVVLWPLLGRHPWEPRHRERRDRPKDTLAHRRVHLLAWCVIPVVVVVIVAWGWFGGVDPTAAGGLSP